MKERPILFSGEMVKAILEGRKTMTRRVVNKDISNQFDIDVDNTVAAYINQLTGDSCDPVEICPYGTVGDRLWVRETWGDLDYYQGNVAIHVLKDSNGVEHDIVYSAECQGYFEWTDEVGFPEYRKDGTEASRWRPSIFMPRWASRITLEITDIKVEQLQDITEEDAIAEGIHLCAGIDEEGYAHGYHWGPVSDTELLFNSATSAYRKLWDSINGRGRKPGKAWNDNPWVWVISFKVVEA